MTPVDVRAILDDITYTRPDGHRIGFVVGSDDGGAAWLQARFWADGALQQGRKYRLSQHMTRSEIVQTALMAVLAAEEHEVREHFLYRGEAVFGPHFDVDALHELAEAKRVDVRVPA